ncbi:hypothetical protein [Roseobacter sp. A03A-229]
MNESIYTSSEIVLFGRLVDDLTIGSSDDTDATAHKPGRKFARIYGFTFDGVYTELGSPVLFMVSDAHKEAKEVPVPGPNPRNTKFYSELKAWIVDKSAETVRLDVDQGKYEDVLLAGAAEAMGGVSGARVSGARVSGARVSGARVSGARVSGARISGASD